LNQRAISEGNSIAAAMKDVQRIRVGYNIFSALFKCKDAWPAGRGRSAVLGDFWRKREKQWSREPDSNRRPTDYESIALPTELSRRYSQGEKINAPHDKVKGAPWSIFGADKIVAPRTRRFALVFV
jgi:hypothetical protein